MNTYKLGEFAKKLNVSVKTLQRWDNAGIFKAQRSPTGRRYYTETQYLEYIGQPEKQENRSVIIYARVSSAGQKDDLKNQITFLREYANAKGIRQRFKRGNQLEKCDRIRNSMTTGG